MASRTRNAEAQAALRARRRAHIDNIETENVQLKEQRDEAMTRIDVFERENEELREEVVTLRHLLHYEPEPSSSSNEDLIVVQRLFKMVRSQRRTIEKLHSAIKKSRQTLNSSLGYDEDLAESTCDLSKAMPATKRSRSQSATDETTFACDLLQSWQVESTPPAPPSLAGTGSTSDTQSLDSPLYNQYGLSRSYPLGAATASSYLSEPLNLHNEETNVNDQTTSVKALSLVLAQPADFKQKVLSALFTELGQQQCFDRDSNINKSAVESPMSYNWRLASSSASIFLLYFIHLACVKNSQVLG